MLKAVIVDDEQPAIDVLKMLIARTRQVEIIGEYTKPSQVVKNVAIMQPDVVFLDIQMPGINGIELADQIIEQVEDIDVVFVTAYRNYAVEAFELNAVDYLLKPALQENVNRAVARLLKLKEMRPITEEHLVVQIKCFGKLEVRNSSDSSPIKWRTAKVEELFAYLLYHRETIVHKEKIIDNLWPEWEVENAVNSLHTTVYRLKKTLKENSLPISIKFSSGGYIMELGADLYCDAIDFETFIAKGKSVNRDNIADFEKKNALYQGDYMEENDYPWCLAERVRIQKCYSYMVKQMVQYYINEEEYKKTENILLRNIEYLPYDEEAYALLLRICSLQGDRISMMKHYGHLETILQQELGIEPQPSLKRLYENCMNDF